jgi:hypothetical protein
MQYGIEIEWPLQIKSLQESFDYVYKKQNPSISFVSVELLKARES